MRWTRKTHGAASEEPIDELPASAVNPRLDRADWNIHRLRNFAVAQLLFMKQDEGFNAASEAYEDLVKAGVIDPAKVVRNALQNASSIASLLLTTEALVSEIPEEKKDAPSMPHGGGMGGMY